MNFAVLALGWLVVGVVAGMFAQIYDDDRAAPGVARPAALGTVGAIGGGLLGTAAIGAPVASVDLGALVGSVLGAALVLLLRAAVQSRRWRRARWWVP